MRLPVAVSLLLGVATVFIAHAGDSTVPSIADELRPYVKQLDHPIYVYHYVTRKSLKVSPSGPLDLADAKVANHVTDYSKSYWDESQPLEPKGSVGASFHGLYVALDPVASRDYGEDDWVLYRVELPADFKYLDITSIEKDADSAPASLWEKLKDCDYPGTKRLPFYMAHTPECRQMALQALKDLKVDAFMYGFVAAGFPGCDSFKYAAMVLLKGNEIPKEKIRIFTKDFKKNDPDMQERIFTEKLFSTAIATEPSDHHIHENKGYRPWPSLDGKPTPVLRDWMKEHLFACGSALQSSNPCVQQRDAVSPGAEIKKKVETLSKPLDQVR